jgi:hypothetical protein
MSKVLKNENICTLCDEKFINNDFVSNDTESLKPNTFEDNTVLCNICGELTPSDKKDTIITTEERT